ncbi:MAG TPA: hypothetical protein VM223_22845 [Planctomycetota bacterium]|nr:hypothetical protein [Planctomycetota bacterium]
MGGIYTLGTQWGGVLRDNVIHDITKYAYGGWGVYNDEGSSEMLVEKNLTCRTATPGYNMHYGRDELVRNNIFALSREAQIGRRRLEQHRSFVYEGNLLYWAEGHMFEGHQNDPQMSHIGFRHNLYWQVGGGPVNFGGITMKDSQALGNDRDSIVADPLFVNPEAGDFRLRPESPALKMGFEPIESWSLDRVSRSPARCSTGASRRSLPSRRPGRPHRQAWESSARGVPRRLRCFP